MEYFEKLSNVSDNMIILMQVILGSRANNLKVILAGGTQMASVLLTVNSILKVWMELLIHQILHYVQQNG